MTSTSRSARGQIWVGQRPGCVDVDYWESQSEAGGEEMLGVMSEVAAMPRETLATTQ